MLRLTVKTKKLILHRLISNNNRTNKPYQDYAKTGSTCLIKSGIVLWLVFFPATQAVSYFGGASIITNSFIKYDWAKSVIEKSREIGRKNVPSWLGERFIEVFITGFSLYFCLKPIRYSMWIYLTQKCVKNNQTAAMLSSRKEVLRKSKQRLNIGYGYFQRKNKLPFQKSKTKELNIEEKNPTKQRIKS